MLWEEATTKAPKCARPDDAVAARRIITSWSARSANVNVVPPTNSGKRTLEPDGDDDMVCWLEVCDKLNESNAFVDDGDEAFTEDMTGATLVRDDVARARVEDGAWYDKFEAYEGVTDESCSSRTGGRRQISCRRKDFNNGEKQRVEARSRLIARVITQKGNDSSFAETPPNGTRTILDQQSCDENEDR